MHTGIVLHVHKCPRGRRAWNLGLMHVRPERWVIVTVWETATPGAQADRRFVDPCQKRLNVLGTAGRTQV
jgi:hypothetical protein